MSSSRTVSSNSLRQQLVSRLNKKPQTEENKPPRVVEVKLSVTETDFVVVEDMTSLNSSAVVLKGTIVFKFSYIPNQKMTVRCSMEGLELFSCNLSNEDESALSILDPVSVFLDLKPSESSKAAPFVAQVFIVSLY